MSLSQQLKHATSIRNAPEGVNVISCSSQNLILKVGEISGTIVTFQTVLDSPNQFRFKKREYSDNLSPTRFIYTRTTRHSKRVDWYETAFLVTKNSKVKVPNLFFQTIF
jgi:hypothetical protein